MRIDTGALSALTFPISNPEFKVIILSTDPSAAVKDEHNRKITPVAVRLENVGCNTILERDREFGTSYAGKRLMLLE
jgi:hypothetical protein